MMSPLLHVLRAVTEAHTRASGRDELPAARGDELELPALALLEARGVLAQGRVERRHGLARRGALELVLERVEPLREFAAQLVHHREGHAVHGRGAQPDDGIPVLGRGIALVPREAISRVLAV